MIRSNRIVSIPGGMLTWLMSRAAEAEADMQLDIQTFTSNGTWTKPANALSCEILIVDGGFGGSGGGYDSGELIGESGTGGEGTYWQIPALFLPATVAVVIGAGGSGGAGAIDSGRGSGVAGGASSFGDIVNASGVWNESFLDASTAYTTLANFGTVKFLPENNGGNGGGIDGAGEPGSGTRMFYISGGDRLSNNGAGGAAGANGTAGGTMTFGAGGGGGGGAVTATSAGGNGGAGGAYGGGGGGGGSGDGTFSGGNGGAGADGVVIIWTITA